MSMLMRSLFNFLYWRPLAPARKGRDPALGRIRCSSAAKITYQQFELKLSE